MEDTKEYLQKYIRNGIIDAMGARQFLEDPGNNKAFVRKSLLRRAHSKKARRRLKRRLLKQRCNSGRLAVILRWENMLKASSEFFRSQLSAQSFTRQIFTITPEDNPDLRKYKIRY